MPETRLPLEALGFPGASAALLNAGASMLTVHFVDADHVLLTYATRGLIKRVPGQSANRDDRLVAALLLEMPSGKVLARAEWHTPDHGRYLWNLGEGRFLLRIGDELSTFAPVANLGDGRAFERIAFPHRIGQIAAVLVSQDSRLLTVEINVTSDTAPADTDSGGPRPKFAAAPGQPDAPAKPAVILDFYRISGSGTLDSPIRAKIVGAAGSPNPVLLPIDGDGLLQANDLQKGRWALAFEPFGSKEIPLAPMDSTCAPTMTLASASQLLALSCRGFTGRVTLMAFDFEKHEMWEESLSESPLPPTFVMAPAAGRFAISRINSAMSEAAFVSVPDRESTATQDVRIYQTQTGDMLLKIDTTPIFRTAENFDLAPDGMHVAVVRGGALEIYRLPALTAGDKEDLAELQKVAPPKSDGKVVLRFDPTPDAAAGAVPGATGLPAPQATGKAIVNGDAQGPRQPPTILKPGESPDFGTGNERPN